MAPKRAASVKVAEASSEEVPPSNEGTGKETKVPGKANAGKSSKPAVVRKVSPHPPMMAMLKEALTELDSRKGVSAQAIRTYLANKYPSMDTTRMKYGVRRALTKGMESELLVRPPNSTGVGAQGRFRLAVRGKAAEAKLKPKENSDPNTEKAPKAAKGPKVKAGAEKTKPAKKKGTGSEDAKPKKDPKGAAASKVAAAKKPKAKRAVAEDGAGATEPNPKVQKTSKATKAEGAETEGAAAPKKAAKGKATKTAGDGGEEGATVPTKASGRRAAAAGDSGGEEQGEAAPKTAGRRGKRAAAAE